MSSFNMYRDLGCSQEMHLPNCAHFGFSGLYLSEHAIGCPSDKYEACTCNPKMRWRETIRKMDNEGSRIGIQPK